jgi:RNA polymerase sigma factor (sigma-70 family)
LDELRQLILDSSGNDRLAQEKLYRRFYPVLFILCKRFFADNHDALEALNNGMLKVFKSIDKFEPEKGTFFNWMYTIVRRAALDKLKLKKSPLTEDISGILSREGTDNPVSSLEWKEFCEGFHVLSPATRVICNLYYVEGFSIKEIGGRLNIRPGTVKWHLSETRRKLKIALALNSYK